MNAPAAPRLRASHRCPRHAAGFTLLETIVTLVIVSLIVVVLMQALQQALGLRMRLLRFERETRMATLQESWFRDSVGAALIELPASAGVMQGDAEGFSLTTAAPLAGTGPAAVRWQLQREREGAVEALLYEAVDARAQPAAGVGAGGGSRGDRAAVRVLSGLRDASFSYLAADGAWKEEWAPGDVEPLPRMVRLTATTGTGRLFWLVAIAADGRQRRTLRPEEANLGL